MNNINPNVMSRIENRSIWDANDVRTALNGRCWIDFIMKLYTSNRYLVSFASRLDALFFASILNEGKYYCRSCRPLFELFSLLLSFIIRSKNKCRGDPNTLSFDFFSIVRPPFSVVLSSTSPDSLRLMHGVFMPCS